MAKKPAKTNAARILDRAKIVYDVLEYEAADGLTDGVSVAAKTGQDAAVVFKTLVAQGAGGQPYVFIIPVAAELDLKRAAKAAGEKKIEMLPLRDLTAVTGYVRGGCSPLGMKKQFPTFLAAEAQELNEILVSAGKIGLQLKLKPQDLLDAARGSYAELTIS